MYLDGELDLQIEKVDRMGNPNSKSGLRRLKKNKASSIAASSVVHHAFLNFSVCTITWGCK